jgi:HTH-type transcriptional regulator / antitoxin HigA
MEAKMNERIPAEVFSPGEFLNDELESRGWTQSEFAEIVRRPTKAINEIIMGKKGVTIDTARELAAALGTSPQYWLNLQTAYDLWKTAPTLASETITRDAQLREKYPVRELIKRGWVQQSESFEVLEQRVFGFYGIANLNDRPMLAHAARRDYTRSYSDLQEAWLFRLKHVAKALMVSKYSERKLREALSRLELLMTEPEEIRKLPSIMSECGVRFAIVEPIANSKIDGACFWLDDASPVVGLTLKGDFIDRVWFNIRHELEHVLRGDGKVEAVVDDFDSMSNDNISDAEKFANEAAAEFCVPQARLNDFILRHDPIYPTASILGFSRLVKRHPGIVAGQLQHKIKRPELFKKLQARVRDFLTSTALTDGYGKELPSQI